MNQKVAELINEQINKELYSAYLYLDFANYFADLGLDGFENWYRVQVKEETDHAMLLLQYLHNNDVSVTLEAVDKPNVELTDRLQVLEEGLKHEKYVTSLINNIYKAADDDHDYRTMQVLDWFVKEQGEEEKNATDLINKMKLFGRDAKGLYQLNAELLGRLYTAPSLVL